MGLNLPFVTAGAQIMPGEIPIYVLTGLSGTFFVFCVAKIIENSSLLSYKLKELGTVSLIIYGIHAIFNRLIIKFIYDITGGNGTDAIFESKVVYIFVCLLTLICSFIFAKIVNKTKYLYFYTGHW